MVDFSTFDLIWHNVFAYGYIQVAVEQTQELRYHLQGKTRKLQKEKKNQSISKSSAGSKSDQSLIAFLDWFQEQKESTACHKFQQTNVGDTSI